MTPEKDRIYYHIGRIHEKKGCTEEAREAWEKAVALPHYTGFEKGYWYGQWRQRYFQALALGKLGRRSEANAFLDAMELLAGAPELPVVARQSILDLVERGRFAPDDEKDPTGAPAVEVATRAEA